jgi:hypothetical protein
MALHEATAAARGFLNDPDALAARDLYGDGVLLHDAVALAGQKEPAAELLRPLAVREREHELREHAQSSLASAYHLPLAVIGPVAVSEPRGRSAMAHVVRAPRPWTSNESPLQVHGGRRNVLLGRYRRRA